jgi:hypothetical protein
MTSKQAKGLGSNHDAHLTHFFWDGHKQFHLLFSWKCVNIVADFPSHLTDCTPLLCQCVSRYDTLWGFNSPCDASQSCCIQAASNSHILSLRWFAVTGPPFCRVNVTGICDRERRLTRITEDVFTHWVIFSILSPFRS